MIIISVLKFVGDVESIRRCIEFIDQHITCKRDSDDDMKLLISFQTHSHTHTCRKGGRAQQNCRFGFPRPPMRTTQILQVLPKDTDKAERKRLKEIFSKIWEKLMKICQEKRHVVQEFDEFINSLEITQEDYILAIRHSIKRTTVFLKRATNEIMINNYNKELLLAWRANMDIQFVLDTYACAKYCVGYVMKAEGGVSKLLRDIVVESKNGNTTIREQLLKFASVLMNGSEISAQEAVAYLLGIRNIYSSRGTVYINTAAPEDRIGILKSQAELDSLPDDSEDVCQKGDIDRYTQRALDLENICLAEFVSHYTFKKETRKQNQRPDAAEQDSGDNTSNDESKFRKIHFYLTIVSCYWSIKLSCVFFENYNFTFCWQ